MPKGKLRVRHLTLAPLSHLDVDRGAETSIEEDDMAQLCLDWEMLSRAIEIKSPWNRTRFRIHVLGTKCRGLFQFKVR
jgi:hypothetical protein